MSNSKLPPEQEAKGLRDSSDAQTPVLDIGLDGEATRLRAAAAERTKQSALSATPSDPIQSHAPRRIQKKSTKKSGKPSSTAILMIVMALALGVYFAQPRQDEKSPEPGPVDSPPVSMAAREADPTLPIPPEEPPQEEPSTRKKILSLLNEVGVFVDEVGATSIQIVVKAQAVCYPGDLDAIKRAFQAKDSLLLSFEALDPKPSQLPVRHSVSLADIELGKRFHIPIDLAKKGVFGIFLCGDAAKEGSCRKKEAANFNRIMNGRGLVEARDAIFYFQFGVIDESYPAIFAGVADGVSEVRGLLGQRYEKQLDEAARHLRNIRSIPPKTERREQVIEVQLPIASLNSKEACPKPR